MGHHPSMVFFDDVFRANGLSNLGRAYDLWRRLWCDHLYKHELLVREVSDLLSLYYAQDHHQLYNHRWNSLSGFRFHSQHTNCDRIKILITVEINVWIHDLKRIFFLPIHRVIVLSMEFIVTCFDLAATSTIAAFSNIERCSNWNMKKKMKYLTRCSYVT